MKQTVPVKITKFFGIGNDDSEVKVWQHLYSENLDFLTSRDYFTLNRKPQNLLNNLSHPVISSYFLSYKDIDANIFCLDNWDIYRWNQKVVSEWPRIFGLVVLWENLFLIDRNTNLYYLPISEVPSNSWTLQNSNLIWPPQTPRPLPTDDYPSYSLEVFLNTLTVAYDSTILIFNPGSDPANTSISDIIPAFNTEIAWVYIVASSNWENLFIICRDWKLLSLTPDFAWVNDAWNLWVRIDSVKKVWEELYILSWSDLYILNWASAKVVYKNEVSPSLNSKKIQFKTRRDSNVIENAKTDLYLVWAPKDSRLLWSYTYNWASLISFKTLRPETEKELNIETSLNYQEEPFLRLYNILFSEERTEQTSIDENPVKNRIYFAYKLQNGTFGIDYIDYSENDENTLNKGMLILPTLSFQESSIDSKVLESIEMLVDFWASEWEIEFYSIENWVAQTLFRKSVEANWFIENLQSSTIKYSDEDNIKKIWEKRLCKLIFNKEFYDITIWMKITHKNQVKRSEALKIYWLTLNLWLEIE